MGMQPPNGPLNLEQLAHAYILSGSNAGETAQAFIQTLLFPERCDQCNACAKLKKGLHPDVCWLKAEGKNIKIEQVRRLHKNALYPPFEAAYKVFVIEDADLLSREAANSLLKILEGPPSYVLFFLLTQRLGDLLPTVVSRCRVVRGGKTSLSGELLEACWNNPLWLETFSAEQQPLASVEPTPEAPTPDALANAFGQSELLALHLATQTLFEAVGRWTLAEVLQMASRLQKLERPQLEYVFQGLNFLCRHRTTPFAPAALGVTQRLSLSYGALRANANVQLLAESVLLTLWVFKRSV